MANYKDIILSKVEARDFVFELCGIEVDKLTFCDVHEIVAKWREQKGGIIPTKEERMEINKVFADVIQDIQIIQHKAKKFLDEVDCSNAEQLTWEEFDEEMMDKGINVNLGPTMVMGGTLLVYGSRNNEQVVYTLYPGK